MQHTCPNNFFNLDSGDIYFLGEFSDGFIRIFVGEGVDVDLHPRRARQGRAAHGRVAVGQIWPQSEFYNTSNCTKSLKGSEVSFAYCY